MAYKLIIFDLDGVIVDTELLHFDAYQKTLKAYHLDLDYSTYNSKLRSKGRQIGLKDLLGPLTKDEIRKIGSEKDQHFLKRIEGKPQIQYQDALNLIHYCRENHIEMAIATASHQGKKLIETYGMTDWFKYIVSAQDITKNKPDPEIYNRCKSYFNYRDEEILVIEDSEAGVKAALAANLEVVFVKRENAPMIDQRLLNHPNVKMVQSLEQLSDKAIFS